MQSEIFEFHLDSGQSDRAEQQRVLDEHFDMRCELERGMSSALFLRSWSLGDLQLVDASLSHLTLRSIEDRDDTKIRLGIVKTGRISIKQGERTRNFGPGEMVLVDAGHVYSATIAENTHLVTLCIPRRCLRERGFEHNFNRLIAPDVSLTDVQVVRDLIFGFADQNADTTPAIRRRQANYLLDLIDVVIEGPWALGRVRSKEATLFRTKQYIERHLRNAHLSPSMVASSACTSVVHLNRLFRAEGTSMMRYLWSRRLEVAAQLLAMPGTERIQIRDIALRCGFSSHAHFSRLFKERYGISPSEVAAGRHMSAASLLMSG